MKRLLGLILVLGLMTGLSLAATESISGTTNISDVPKAGLFKTHLTAIARPGAICVNGSNVYKRVYNVSGTAEFQGAPAFYSVIDTDDYSVGYCTETASRPAFAGIWYCDADTGDPTIEAASWGWLTVAGSTGAYVSRETTAIGVGSSLYGIISGPSVYDSAGDRSMGYDAAYGTEPTNASQCISLSTRTATSAAIIPVHVKAKY